MCSAACRCTRLQFAQCLLDQNDGRVEPLFELIFASMSSSDVVLYTYWRSSCSWRVRIALHWKGVPFESRFINLVANGGQQHSQDYMDVNPQKLVRYSSLMSHCSSSLNHFPDSHPAHRRLQAVTVSCYNGVPRRDTPVCWPRTFVTL